jgi:hypothetical protein
MSEQLYCDVPDCDDPSNPGFARPSFRNGKCSSHMKQLQRTGETKPITEKLPLTERLVEVYSLYAEADSDEDAARHRRQFMALTKQVGRHEFGEAIREALRRRKAAGKPIGRPPRVPLEELVRIYELLKSVSATARVVRLAKSTVSERLATVRKSSVTERKRPRLAG